jgi:hypothetical protein
VELARVGAGSVVGVEPLRSVDADRARVALQVRGEPRRQHLGGIDLRPIGRAVREQNVGSVVGGGGQEGGDVGGRREADHPPQRDVRRILGAAVGGGEGGVAALRIPGRDDVRAQRTEVREAGVQLADGAGGVEHDVRLGLGDEVGLRPRGVVEAEVVGEDHGDAARGEGREQLAVRAQRGGELALARRRAVGGDAGRARAVHQQGRRAAGRRHGREGLGGDRNDAAVQPGRVEAQLPEVDRVLDEGGSVRAEDGAGAAPHLLSAPALGPGRLGEAPGGRAGPIDRERERELGVGLGGRDGGEGQGEHERGGEGGRAGGFRASGHRSWTSGQSSGGGRPLATARSQSRASRNPM